MSCQSMLRMCLPARSLTGLSLSLLAAFSSQAQAADELPAVLSCPVEAPGATAGAEEATPSDGSPSTGTVPSQRALANPSSLAAALKALQSGKLVQARDQLRTLAAQTPGDPRVLYSLAVVEDRTGELKRAVEAARGAFQAAPTCGDTALLAARLLEASRQPEEALHILARAVSLQPGDLTLRHRHARALVSLGRLEAAATALDQLRQAAPKVATYHLEWAEVQAWRGLAKEAVSGFVTAEGLSSERLSYRRQATYADALREAGEPAKALQGYDRLIASGHAWAEVYYGRGLALSHLKRHNEAISSLRKALELKPGLSDAREALARAYHGAGRTSDAARIYRQALTLAPDDVALRVEAAQVLSSTPSMRGEALSLLMPYLKNPQAPKELVLTAAEILSWDAAHRPEALLYLATLLAKEPQEPRAWKIARQTVLWMPPAAAQLAWVERLLAHDAQDAEMIGYYAACLGKDATRQKDALQAYSRAIELQPNETSLRLSRAALALKLLPQERSAHILELERLANSDGRPQVQKQVGFLFLSLDDPARALVCFDRGLQTSPESVELLRGRGEALAALDRSAEAVEVFARLVELSPERRDKQAYQRRLEGLRRDASRSRAQALAEAGQVTAAEEVLQNLLKVDPMDVDSRLLLGGVLSRKGEHAGALACFLKVLELEDATISTAPASTSGSDRAAESAASSLVPPPSGSADAVASSPTQAGTASPSPAAVPALAPAPKVWSSVALLALRGASGSLMALERYAEAIPYLEKEVAATDSEEARSRLAEARARVNWSKAQLFLDKGQKPQARTMLSGLYAQNPELPGVALQYGLLLLESGETGPASEALQVALRVTPDNVSALRGLANALWKLGKVPEARQHLARARLLASEADRPGIEAQLVGWDVALGEKARAEGDLLRALDAYRLAFAVAPLEGYVLKGLGGLYWQNGQPGLAARFYARAAALDPNDEDALASAVETLLQNDSPEAARALLDQLVPAARPAPGLGGEAGAAGSATAQGTAVAGGDGLQPRANNTSLYGGLLGPATPAHTPLSPRRAALEDKVAVALGLKAVETRWQTGERALAEREALTLAAQHAGSPLPFLKLAQLYGQEGSHLEAARYSRLAFERNPQDLGPLMSLIASLQALQHYEEADSLIFQARAREQALGRVAPGLDRLEAVGAAALAERYRQAGQLDLALTQFNRAFALKLVEPWMVKLAGELYERYAQPEQALILYEAGLRVAPDDVELLRARMRCLAALGRTDEAMLLLANLRNAGAATAREEVIEAELAKVQGRTHAALELYTALQQRYPRDIQVARGLMGCLLDEKRPDDALRVANAFMPAAAGDVDLLETTAGALQALTRNDLAVPVLRKVVLYRPTPEVQASLQQSTVAAYVDQAEVAKRGGDLEQSRELYGRALELSPENVDVIRGAAGVALAQGRVVDAAAGYRQVLERRPDDGLGLVGLASCQMAEGRTEKAVKALREGFQRTREPVVGLELAELLLSLDRAMEATPVVAEVGRLLPPPENGWRTRLGASPGQGEAETRFEQLWIEHANAPVNAEPVLKGDLPPVVASLVNWRPDQTPDAPVARAPLPDIAPELADPLAGPESLSVRPLPEDIPAIDLQQVDRVLEAVRKASEQPQGRFYAPGPVSALPSTPGVAAGLTPRRTNGFVSEGAIDPRAAAPWSAVSGGAVVPSNGASGNGAESAPWLNRNLAGPGGSRGEQYAPFRPGASTLMAKGNTPEPTLWERSGLARERLQEQTSPGLRLGGLVDGRSGTMGSTALFSSFGEVRGLFSPGGAVSLEPFVAPGMITDGVTSYQTVMAGVGLNQRPGPFSLSGLIATSPIGFPGGVKPRGQAAVRLAPADLIALTVEGAYEDVPDSLLSWAGSVESGSLHGALSRTRGGASLTLVMDPYTTLVGGGQLAWISGDQVDDNRFRLGQLELTRRIPLSTGQRLTLGAGLVVFGFEKQLDGFELTQGGYFSPPFFALGRARLGFQGGRWNGLRYRLSLDAGGQYTTGEATDQLTPGLRAALAGTGELSWRLSRGFFLGGRYSFDNVGAEYARHTGQLFLERRFGVGGRDE